MIFVAFSAIKAEDYLMRKKPSSRPFVFNMLHVGTALFYLLIGVILFLGLHLSWSYINPFLPQEQLQHYKLGFDVIYLVTGISLGWLYVRHHQQFVEHQNNELRLRSFIKHAPVAVAMLDNQMRYIEASDRWLRDYHLDDMDIRGQNHYDVFSFIDFNDTLLGLHQRCLQGETFRRNDVEFTNLIGLKEWVNYEMAPWRHPDGTIGGIIFFSENITDRKETENRLKESEARFTRAINGSHDILWDLNIPQREIYHHPRLLQLLGYSEDEMGMKLDAWKKILHPQDFDRVKHRLAEHFSNHTPFNVEYRMRAANGQYYWFHTRGEAERDAMGKAVRMSGFMTDITDKKQLENIKQEFVYVVTHELRTPLTALKGALDMLPILLGKDIPQRVEKMLDLAMLGSERLMRLINDLLTVGEVESETMRFDMQECSVSTLLQNAVQHNQAYAASFNVQLHLEDKSPDVLILVDDQRFLQIMSNLISNAVKFSPEDSYVFIQSVQDRDMVRITVTDHGSGIPENFRGQIFQKFAQHDKNKPGSGLGLSITKTMVERMNGKIGFDSVEGKGTSFYIDFPVTYKLL